MEYFGGLSDFMMSPIRDVVVGTPPDSLLTLVSQDLPEDIFQDDEEASPVDAIDAVMDSNAGEINLASVSPVSSGMFMSDVNGLMDDDSETDDVSYVSDEVASPGGPFEDCCTEGSTTSSTSSSSTAASVVGTFFTDHLDVKEVVVGDIDDCPPADVMSSNVILPPSDYVFDSESDSTVYVKQEQLCDTTKVRHTSSESYDSNYSSSTSSNEAAASPPPLPGSMSLDDLEEEDEEDEHLSSPPLSSDRKESSVKRPRMSYAQLIAEALLNSADRRLTLNDIYVHINARHPYYSLKGGKGWQNAVRHNLTLNKSFVKVPRPANEGRGSWWELEAGAEKGIFKRLLRQHYMYKVALDTKQQQQQHPYTVQQCSPSSSSSSSQSKPEAAVRSAPPSAVKASATVRAAAVKTVKRAQPAPPKPQIKIIKSIPLVSPKVGAAVTSSSSSKPTIIYVTLPRHLFNAYLQDMKSLKEM